MSQFDFPRINFHGSVLLDTPTANNGKTSPLVIYDQNNAQPYLPPRLYLTPTQITYVKQNYSSIPVQPGGYVEISPISTITIFQQWAVAVLGTYPADQAYWPLYTYCQVLPIAPGYWNYFGDLSMSLQNVLVTGVQLPGANGKVTTWTPQNQSGCPPVLAQMLGASLSFNSNFFDPQSRTTAYLCDVDSEGQMCTQIFCGNAGIYSNNNGVQKTFFSGTPCKSTARWMNLTKVLNWSDPSLVPMGGSACFYSTIPLANCDSDLKLLFEQYAGEPIDNFFMRFVIHQVHEVRNPDYSKMPGITLGNGQTVPKNPASVAISGSICPWKTGDMKTAGICRILKNSGTVAINPKGIPTPVPKGSSNPVTIPPSVSLAPVFLNYDMARNILSLDIINSICEYGTTLGTLPSYAGTGDVPYFTNFDTYHFDQASLDVYFQKDGSPLAIKLGGFSYANDFNMQQYLATGGMVDINPITFSTYSQGRFYISIGTNKVLLEDDVFISTDQQGTYAEQNQVPENLYLNDGLPKVPITMRAFFRGQPIPSTTVQKITVQSINMLAGTVSNIIKSIYDGMPYVYPVNNDGCMTYNFAYSVQDLLSADFSNIFIFTMRGCITVNRVLSSEPQLQPYLNGQLPVTWDVVYQNVFKCYHAILPIMNVIVPFTQANWSDPFMINAMLQFTDQNNWSKPLYMPITRELSASQRQLLQLWAQQIKPA